MKTKYYVIIGTIVVALIGGILLVRSVISPSASPSATVKAFYRALNKGDIKKVEEYVSPGANIEDFLLTGIITRSPRKYYREGWKSLAGKIQKIEIKGEQTGKASGTDVAEVVIQVVLKPGVEDQAEIKRIEFIRTHSGYPFGNFDDKVHSEAAKYWFMAIYFSEEQTCGLEKWHGKWKIVFITRTR